MNQTDTLSTIIREVSEDVRPASQEEIRLIINTTKKQAVDKVPFWSAGDEHKYFIVCHKKTIGSKVHIPYTEGMLDGQKLDITVFYRARCKHGLVERLALFVTGAGNHGAGLEKMITETVNNHLGSNREGFFDDYEKEKSRLKSTLVTEALQKAGLILEDVRLIISGQDDLETITLGPVVIPIHFMDCDREEELTIKAELEIDDKRTLRALLNQNKPITDLIRKATRKYFADKVSINTYCAEPDSFFIKEGLTLELNKALKPIGRHIGHIFLDAETACPRSFKDDMEILYKHHEYPDPIPIKFSVLMIPENFARYRVKKSVPLRSWVETKLKAAMDIALFGKEYVDLLIGMDPIRERIKREMTREAAEIGYIIEHLITLPDLPPFQWLKQIEVANNTEKYNFKTRIPNCSVELSISLTARVKDLQGIANRLSRKEDVPQKMKESVLSLIRRYMERLNPERFYTHFYGYDEDEISVEKELEAQISKLLKKEFNAEIVHLALNQEETLIAKDYQTLIKEAHDFKVEIRRDFISQTQTATVSASIDSGNGNNEEQKVSQDVSIGSVDHAGSVSGTFIVESVDEVGWKRFQECDRDVKKIKKRIEDTIKVELKSYINQFLVLSSQTVLEAIKYKVNAAAIECIRKEFGLRISISTVSYNMYGIREALAIHFREKYGREILKLESDLMTWKLDKDEEMIKLTEGRLRTLHEHIEQGLLDEGDHTRLLPSSEEPIQKGLLKGNTSLDDEKDKNKGLD